MSSRNPLKRPAAAAMLDNPRPTRHTRSSARADSELLESVTRTVMHLTNNDSEHEENVKHLATIREVVNPESLLQPLFNAGLTKAQHASIFGTSPSSSLVSQLARAIQQEKNQSSQAAQANQPDDTLPLDNSQPQRLGLGGAAVPGSSQEEDCAHAENEEANEPLTSNSEVCIASTFATVVELRRGNRLPYIVHLDYLVRYSKTFERAFASPSWQNGSTLTYDLEEEDVGIELFLRYVYTGRLYCPQSLTESDVMHGYIFGDKYICQSFKNACMDAIYERKKQKRFSRTDWPSIRLAYANLPPTDKMLNFLSLCFIQKSRRSDNRPDIKSAPGGTLPVEFLEDIIVGLTALQPADPKYPLSLDGAEICKTFHDHRNGGPLECPAINERVIFTE